VSAGRLAALRQHSVSMLAPKAGCHMMEDVVLAKLLIPTNSRACSSARARGHARVVMWTLELLPSLSVSRCSICVANIVRYTCMPMQLGVEDTVNIPCARHHHLACRVNVVVQT
jgi:hypothetical protein